MEDQKSDPEPQQIEPESEWKELARLAEEASADDLVEYVEQLSENERVHDFTRLTAEARGHALERLPPEQAAEIIEALPTSLGAESLEEIEPELAADIVEELPSDEQADLLGELPTREAEAILSAVEPEVAEAVRDLLQYEADTAGGRMVTEYVSIPDSWDASEAVAHLQQNAERFAHFVVQYLYVVDNERRLLGVLPLRDLLLCPPGTSIRALMRVEPISLRAADGLEPIFEKFDQHNYVGVPVVDEAERLVGLLLRHDVDEARVDRADAQALAARGIVGGEELRSLPLFTRSGRRLSWLSINIVLNVIAASVIAFYEETLQAVIALAVFLPIISDMSGCSGNQAVAVSLRELSLGVTRPSEVGRVLFKESSVGLLNGVALGSLLGGLAWLWKGSALLGLVVGGALALNTLVAVCIGGAVPLVVRRMGYDPALASGPMLTTVTDLCGFFLVLSMVSALLLETGI